MFSYETVGDGRRPPWWRTLLWVLLTALAGLVSVVFSPLSIGMSQPDPPGTTALLAVGAMLVAVALPVVLFWRHRFPFLVVVVSAAVSLVVPIGNALPLTALACLLGRRRGAAVWWAVVGVAVTSAWALWRDVTAQPKGASLWKAILSPVSVGADQNYTLSTGEVVGIYAAGLGLAITLGVLVQWRRHGAAQTTTNQQVQEAATRLGDEVARRQERERIAREVHDAMGHRLSVLNLHAGALEAQASQDPRVAASAQTVRESAGAAMDDLRSLLDVLREPVEAELPPVPLSELATVVNESFGAGQSLNSSIFIDGADTADPALSRAVYRIVQEVLTNARKHAPHESVFLTVNGGPATGIAIDVRNRYVGGWGSGTVGSSRGLGGIRERVELLGGQASYGMDGEWFRVTAHLPWRTRA